MFGQQCARANKAEATAAAPAARKKIQQQLKPFSSKQTAAVATFLDILHDVLVLHCPLYSVQFSLSVLIYWRLAHCLGCQKKERKRERKRGGGHGEKESKPGKKAKNKIDRSWIEKKVAHSE